MQIGENLLENYRSAQRRICYHGHAKPSLMDQSLKDEAIRLASSNAQDTGLALQPPTAATNSLQEAR
jgi:hypothetical protein